MYTVITKGNNVHQYVSFDLVERSVEGPFLAIDSGDGSKVAFTATNPITWPDSATDGTQAIVDVKTGTLRFGYDGWSWAQTEFVVSEYVEPFVSVDDRAPVHVLDLIKEWPMNMPPQHELESVDGHKWEYVHGKWVLSSKVSDREFHEGHWLNHHENKKKHSGVSVQVGTKHDHGKPILGAVPPHAELAVGRVLTFGAEKYARGNWDKVEDHENRYMDAALRHLNAHRRGELVDSESGESHLAHAACCILFMLDKQERSC